MPRRNRSEISFFSHFHSVCILYAQQTCGWLRIWKMWRNENQKDKIYLATTVKRCKKIKESQRKETEKLFPCHQLAVWRIQPQNMISQANIIIQKFVRQSNVNLIHDIYILLRTHTHTQLEMLNYAHTYCVCIQDHHHKLDNPIHWKRKKNTFEWIYSCLTFKPIIYVFVSFGEILLLFNGVILNRSKICDFVNSDFYSLPLLDV